MKYALQTVLAMLTAIAVTDAAIAQQQQADRPGTEEFGLSMRQLVQNVEKVETLIAKCMQEQGFEYVAADFKTVRRGMIADKSMPGMDEEEFTQQYGFGVATLYTGLPPQLVEGYSPARVGLGDKNVQIFKGLSPADQAAYNRALLGENTDATFAVALEIENFSRCGGCTLKAIQQVFKEDQLKPTYRNPKDELINKDPRMKAALRTYAERMRAAGFEYTHPDQVETDIRDRLVAITGGEMVPVDKLPSECQAALKKLQEFERRVGVISYKLQGELFEPVEEQIEKEMYPREVK